MVCGMLSVVVERTPAGPTALHIPIPIPILSRKTPGAEAPAVHRESCRVRQSTQVFPLRIWEMRMRLTPHWLAKSASCPRQCSPSNVSFI